MTTSSQPDADRRSDREGGSDKDASCGPPDEGERTDREDASGRLIHDALPIERCTEINVCPAACSENPTSGINEHPVVQVVCLPG